MEDWPKTYTKPEMVMNQDDGEPAFDRCQIGTASYKVGKVTRSKPARVKATPNVKTSEASRKKA